MSVGLLGLLIVVSFTLVSAAVIDVPRQWSARGVTGLGYLTIALTAIGTIALLAGQTLPVRALRVLAPYAAMLLWAVATMAWAPPRRGGLQTGAVLASFLVLALVAAAAMVRDRTRTEQVLAWSMRAADVIGLGLVAASLVLRGWPTNIDVVPWFVHPRALALFGLVPLSWHLARWVRGDERSGIVAVIWVGALFVSLSRLATATALLLLLLAGLLRGRQGSFTALRKSHYLMLLLVPVVFVAIFTVAPFRARFVTQDGRGASAEKLELRDNGRTAMWDGVARSAAEAPFLGKGLGSSETVVSDTYYWVGHPHNEFLRIWHDLGLPGLILLLATLWTIGSFCWRQLSGAVLMGVAPEALPLAASGVLIALVAGMTTDNPLVYGFVMAPTAIVIGAALGSETRQRRRRKRRTQSDTQHTQLEEMPAVTATEGSLPSDSIPPEVVRVRRRRRRRG